MNIASAEPDETPSGYDEEFVRKADQFIWRRRGGLFL